MTAEPQVISAFLRQQFPDEVLASHQYRGDDTVVIKPGRMLEVFRFLRDEPRAAFTVLMDLAGVDYLAFGRAPSTAPSLATPSPLPYFMKPKAVAETWERGVGESLRFEVVYHLYSLPHNHRLRVRLPVDEREAAVDSVAGLWQSANWFEREVWDMYGIRFRGHPNLTRILMYDAFDGHPLRKDYPINKRQPLIGPKN